MQLKNLKRATVLLSLATFLCCSGIAAPKQRPAQKPTVAHRSVWRRLLIPAKYALAGILRLKLNSKGEPYE